MVQAGSHIELRKRNEAFKAKAGKKAPLKVADPLDKKKPIPRWVVWTFLLLLGGGSKYSQFLDPSQLPFDVLQRAWGADRRVARTNSPVRAATARHQRHFTTSAAQDAPRIQGRSTAILRELLMGCRGSTRSTCRVNVGVLAG